MLTWQSYCWTRHRRVRDPRSSESESAQRDRRKQRSGVEEADRDCRCQVEGSVSSGTHALELPHVSTARSIDSGHIWSGLSMKVTVIVFGVAGLSLSATNAHVIREIRI